MSHDRARAPFHSGRRPGPRDLRAQRAAEIDAGLEAAREIAVKLELLHRTGRRPGWKAILDDNRIDVGEPRSEVERHVGPAAYFFVGYPAYPHGAVCFLVRPRAIDLEASRFSPFDSGSLGEPKLQPIDPAMPWALADRLELLDRHSGVGSELEELTPSYLAAHFLDARDYVRRPARSRPDWPPAHGLRDPNDDRRAWTLELRAHAAVDLEPSVDGGTRLVVATRDLLEELEAPWRDVAYAADAEAAVGDDTERMARKCAILQGIE